MPEKIFEDLFFGKHALVSLVLGLEHSCPWPRKVLSSEGLSLASDFFCVLGLGLEPCVLHSISASYPQEKFLSEALARGNVATVGPGASSPSNDCLCPFPFRFIQDAFLEHHVTTRQQAILEKGIIIIKHVSRLKFSRLFAKLLVTTAVHKCDPIICLINGCVAEWGCMPTEASPIFR